MYPAFQIAIGRLNGDGDQIVVLNGAPIASGSGPLLPMHSGTTVADQIMKIQFFRIRCQSCCLRVSVTTFEPAARLVLTQGLTCKPRLEPLSLPAGPLPA